MGTWSAHGWRQLSCSYTFHRWHCLADSGASSKRQYSSITNRLPYSQRICHPQISRNDKGTCPRAFDYGIAEDENDKVGVSYIFLEEVAGRTWNSSGPHGKRSANDKDKEKVWNGLADILIELKRHPFPKAGSLLPGSSPSKPIVSAVTSERFLVLSPSGPFPTAKDYYTSFVEQNMALIADRQLFTSFPVNAYLVFLFLKSQIQNLTSTSNHDLETTEQFYLKHVDDKGIHLMVDDKLNIVGIIDWQMARVVPASEAFGPSLVIAEMGLSALTVHDQALARFLKVKGEDDLADIMGKDEKLRRFFFGLDVDFSWDETLLLIRGIWAVFGIDKNSDWNTFEKLKGGYAGYIHDERLEKILDDFGAGP